MSPVGQDQRVPRLRAEGSVHEGTATSHQAVGGRPVGARRQCLLAGSVKNSEGRWRVLRVMIRGTSSPCAKFMGDFGSATEAVQIIDLFALQVFAKNFDRCNFRVLQHNRPQQKYAGGRRHRGSSVSPRGRPS